MAQQVTRVPTNLQPLFTRILVVSKIGREARAIGMMIWPLPIVH